MTVKRTILRRKNYGDGGKGKTAIHINEAKTESSHRVIPLDDITLRELKSHKSAQASERLLLGAGYANEGFVFASPTGLYVEPRTYQDIFKRIVANAGIADTNFHAMRHTFATRALEIGIPAKTVAEILGHKNVATTLNLYSHVSVDTKREAIDRMAAAFKGL
jgi:integrase